MTDTAREQMGSSTAEGGHVVPEGGVLRPSAFMGKTQFINFCGCCLCGFMHRVHNVS